MLYYYTSIMHSSDQRTYMLLAAFQMDEADQYFFVASYLHCHQEPKRRALNHGSWKKL